MCLSNWLWRTVLPDWKCVVVSLSFSFSNSDTDCLVLFSDPCAGFVCLDNQECDVHEQTGEPFCADSCEKTRCPHGQICQLDDVVCVREPCPPVAKCIGMGKSRHAYFSFTAVSPILLLHETCKLHVFANAIIISRVQKFDVSPCFLLADPCSNKECGAGQECLIYKPTGEAYCADTCDNRTCPEGQKCQLIPVVCVRAPCPPHAECVPIPTGKHITTACTY